MKLRYTLVSDGPTDAVLIPIIDWILKNTTGVELTEGVPAELWRLKTKPETLAEKLAKAVELHPCDVLFVHRDAERQSHEKRLAEILDAQAANSQSGKQWPTVAVVPVRMLEAWLCFDECAVRKAANNPRGKVPLNLPPLKRIEASPDPKEDLKAALLAASELKGRRLKKFDNSAAFWKVVDHIEDFSPLRQLPAFQRLETAILELKRNEWGSGFYG
jgi:hypothetical protein